jgi:2'-5' RNA ligase
MKRRRTFVAINLPPHIQEKLASYKESFYDLPARWTKKENLHITLFFLGYLQDEDVVEISQILQEAARNHSPFEITLSHVMYAPKEENPRFVWAAGESNTDLNALYNDLRSRFASFSLEPQEHEYIPHVTLARISQMHFRQLEQEERPQIEESITFSFPVSTIELMESHLRKGSPIYDAIETAELQSL